MSDKILPVQGGEVRVKYVDQGDGSHAQVFANGAVQFSRLSFLAGEYGVFPSAYLSDYMPSSGTILFVNTIPGATNPDDNYDITLVDADGVDRFENRLLNRDSVASQSVTVMAPVASGETLTFNLSGNTVEDAEVDVVLFWVNSVLPPLVTDSNGVQPVYDSMLLASVDVIKDAVKNEDDPHLSTDKGVLMFGVRNDSAATLTDTDLDYSPIAVDSAGRLLAIASDSKTEDAAHSSGATGTFILGVRNDANVNFTDTDGDYSPVRVSARGNVVIEGGIAHDAADMGNPVKIGGVYHATFPTLTDGDRADANTDAAGNIVVHPVWGVSPGNFSVGAPDNVDAVTVATGSSRLLAVSRGTYFNGTSWDRARGDTAGAYVHSGVASGATDAGNPVKIGGKYNTTPPTFTNGQRGDAQITDRGEIYVRPSIKLVTFTWTPTLDTASYSAGDNMYTTLYEIQNVARYVGGSGRIVDFFSRDGDLQSKAHTLHVFDRSITIPAANAAWSISDADNQYRACAPINSGQFVASALNSSSSNPNIAVPFQCKSDSMSLWVAVVTSEAPTHTASGVQYGIRVELD